MQSPLKQLIMDLLVCARDLGANYVIIPQGNMKRDILTSLLFKQINNLPVYHFCKCILADITEDKFCYIILMHASNKLCANL